MLPFPYVWQRAAPNIAKRAGRFKNWQGMIGKPILRLSTFWVKPILWFLLGKCMFWAPEGAKNLHFHVESLYKGPKKSFLVRREAALAADLITA